MSAMRVAAPTRSGRSNGVPAAAVVGVAAMLVSLVRLWLANPSAIASVMWAEDGLFPLCVRKAGFLTCLLDPFAGYSIFLPRVMAGITALFPLEAWAVVANLIAAGLVGIIAGLTMWWLSRAGVSRAASLIIALLPVVIPIVGFEAVNVIASIYMPMLFLATLVLVVPINPFPAKSVGALLLVVALTIPSALVLLVILGVQGILRVIPRRSVALPGLLTLLGLGVQAVFAFTAEKPRQIAPGLESLAEWANAVPSAILTFWPGLSLGETGVFTNYVSRPAPWTAALIVVLIGAGGIWLMIRNRGWNRSVGWLLIAGLALGAFPAVIGDANNRYFVVPCLLWAAAGVLALDGLLRRSAALVVIAGVVVVGLIWWPAFPASEWRTTPAPDWPSEVDRAVARCSADPGAQERLIFSPFWPPNWGDALSEPSHPDVPCLDLWSPTSG